jgi:hypothetical protein
MDPSAGKPVALINQTGNTVVMPTKHNEIRRLQFPVLKSGVRNQAEFETGLRRRECLAMWVIGEAMAYWLTELQLTPDKRPYLADLTIVTRPILRLAFHPSPDGHLRPWIDRPGVTTHWTKESNDENQSQRAIGVATKDTQRQLYRRDETGDCPPNLLNGRIVEPRASSALDCGHKPQSCKNAKRPMVRPFPTECLRWIARHQQANKRNLRISTEGYELVAQQPCSNARGNSRPSSRLEQNSLQLSIWGIDSDAIS